MKHALIKTSLGNLIVELDEAKAPKTVANFLSYVAKKQYNGTIFHRVIDGFMIQGGGMEPGLKQRPTDEPITNEANNGLKNLKYTIAMARTNDPHSATAQFFINVNDNGFLDHSSPTPQGWGYAVFGQVIEGKDIVDEIRRVKTGNKGFHQDVPLQDVLILDVQGYDYEAGVVEGEAQVIAEVPVVDAGTIVPVYRAESMQYFSHDSLVKPWLVKFEGGDPIATSAFIPGETFSLLGISQTQSLLEAGLLDVTDSIDPAISLKALHIKTPDGEVVRIDVSQAPTSAFTYGVVNNYREVTLDAKFDKLRLTNAAGETTALSLMMVGRVNLELADTVVHAGPILADVDGFETGYALVGYELSAKRINHNRRPRKAARGESTSITYLDEPAFIDNSGKFAQGNTIETFKVEGADTTLELRIGDEAAEVSGANHYYVFSGFDTETNPLAGEGFAGQRLSLHLLFQNGTIPEVGVNGVTLEAVLAACGHRLEGFQSGKFACDDNQEALDHINAAIAALQRRTRNRIARGVEGSHTA